MAIKSLADLRSYFEKGDKPTQQQFWDWMDSYIHKQDGVTMLNVAGLVAALTGKADVTALALYATKDKSVITAENVGALAGIAPADAGLVLVRQQGIYAVFDAGAIPADVTETHPGATAGKVWGLVLAPGSGGGGLVNVLDGLSGLSEAGADGNAALIISEHVRGGTFVKYAGAQAVDNGIIFLDANGEKWRRVITGDCINVTWYPIEEGTPMDSIFNQIMTAALNKENIAFPRIYFPANSGLTAFYQFASSITIDNKVEIYGDGAESKIRFNANIPGIITNYITSRFTVIRDISVFGSSSGYASGVPLGSNWDTNQHGINARDIIYCKNVHVHHFAGNGFNLVGSVPASNVNNSKFELCGAFQNRIHGFYMQGSDANAMLFDKCEAVANGGCGVKDDSFLGNHYLNFHSATNGSPEMTWQRGLIKNGTNVYACLLDNTVGIEPGVTAGWATNWRLITEAAWYGWPTVGAYDATRSYYATGAFRLTGLNQYGTFTGCYAEQDQAMSYISQRNLVLNFNNPLIPGSAGNLLANGDIYSSGPIWSGNPANAGDYRSVMNNQTGFGQTKGGGTGFSIDYDDSKKAMNIGQYGHAKGVAGVSYFLTGAFGAYQGRTNAKNHQLAIAGILMASASSRSNFFNVDLALVKPGTASTDNGDLYLCTGNNYFHYKPDDVMVSYRNLISLTAGTIDANTKLFVTKGYFEDSFSSPSPGNYPIVTDYNIADGKGIVYSVLFCGTSATDNCLLERRIFVRNTGGTVAVVQSISIGTDINVGVFATTTIVAVIAGGDDVTLRIENMPEAAQGKIHVKRMLL